MKTIPAFVTVLALSTVAAAEPPRGSITIERIAAIRHPSDPQWSPDGRHVAFSWDDAGVQNLFAVSPGEAPRALTDFEADPETATADIDGFEWLSPDALLVLHGGQLWKATLSGGITRWPGAEDVRAFAFSPDRGSVAILSGSELSLASSEGGPSRVLASFPVEDRITGLVFSPGGERIAFTASRSRRVVDFPEYSGAKLGLARNEVSDHRVGIVSSRGGGIAWRSVEGRPGALQWIDGETILFERTSFDMKTREILAAGLDGTLRRLRTDHDPRWFSPIRRDARTTVSPDGRWVAFVSDESGWAHLYVIRTEGSSEIRRLTSGAFEVGFGSWSFDSKQIAFYHNEGSRMERFVSVVDVETGTVTPVVTGKGVSFWPRYSPDGSRILYEHTDTEDANDLYLVPASGGGIPQRLTSSMPPEIRRSDWTAPTEVSFPSRVDGAPVPGTLFVPRDLDPSLRHPAIVWIHGSGSEQNFLGWHPFNYRMYYSVHQYLVQQGYVVLAVDYRGSSGYGRDWGTGHYRDLGGSDYLDVASGADYLTTLPYVDAERIGVWGLSYGGFMTLQALTVTPALFRCGIDVAGVSDWATWGLESSGGWITGRMGTPEDNPEGYFRSASIRHMDALARPLLILHGTADVNVAFRESLNLIDVLLRKGKDFDFVVYPGELHWFRRRHVLEDAWRRVEAFFDEHLKNGGRTSD